MTKLKKKDEYSLPEGCFNCKFVIIERQNGQSSVFTDFKCSKTNKYHLAIYLCKKWRIQE